MLHRLALEYCPAHFPQQWKSSKYGNNYLCRTIKSVSSQIMKHSRAIEAEPFTVDNQEHQTPLGIITRSHQIYGQWIVCSD